jgi:hypothetical protein
MSDLAVDEKALEEVSAADRDWFAAHPERSMYLRHPHAVEQLEGWHPDLTLVIQAQPGVRCRVPYRAGNVAHKQYPESITEAGCRRIWAELERHYPQNAVVQTVQTMQALAAGDEQHAE